MFTFCTRAHTHYFIFDVMCSLTVHLMTHLYPIALSWANIDPAVKTSQRTQMELLSLCHILMCMQALCWINTYRIAAIATTWMLLQLCIHELWWVWGVMHSKKLCCKESYTSQFCKYRPDLETQDFMIWLLQHWHMSWCEKRWSSEHWFSIRFIALQSL